MLFVVLRIYSRRIFARFGFFANGCKFEQRVGVRAVVDFEMFLDGLAGNLRQVLIASGSFQF